MKFTLIALLIFVFTNPLSCFTQPDAAAFPSIAPPTGTTEIPRGNPFEMIERAVKAWEDVYDCRIQLHQVEKMQDKPITELWAYVTLTKSNSQNANLPSSFLLEFFAQPSSFSINGMTPEIVFYAATLSGNVTPKLFTYSPNKKTVQIEWLDEDSPLPDFLKLAGFLKLDVQEIRERAFLEDEIFEEYINGIPTIRVRLKPRTSRQNLEPDRYLWLHRDTYFPVRFAVDDLAQIIVDFDHYQINQKIDPKELVPKVPNDTFVNDLTRQH